MIVDTSAVIAVLKHEEGSDRYADALSDPFIVKRMSAANYLEAGIIVDANGNPLLSRLFDDLLSKYEVILEPVTVEQAHFARAAYRDFGKGSGHPARLNFGDCFAYALARAKREPMLFKGEDFAHAGIERA